MIVVTGGAGFIGSQLVAGLNKLGREDIIIVDDLTDGKKFENLVVNKIADYIDKIEFRRLIAERNSFCDQIDFIFHQGACSTTTEWDGQYMMDNNYTCSKELLHFCIEQRTIPFVYASSAAVYGVNTTFSEEPANEQPVNVYGYSKLLFDNYVRGLSADIKSQIIGLRYFNVYGPGEKHKEGMASVVFHFNNQVKETGELKLFEGSDGYADGEQLRDFISVDDVVNINLWMMDNPDVSGIFNVGTGKANSFNDVANLVVDWHGKGSVKYIYFPDKLKGSYQSFTAASLDDLRSVGCKYEFTPLNSGVNSYLDILNSE